MTVEELLARCELVRASEKRMADVLGHSDIFATLSLRYPPTPTIAPPLYFARAGV